MEDGVRAMNETSPSEELGLWEPSPEVRTLLFVAIMGALSGLSVAFPMSDWEPDSIAGLANSSQPLVGLAAHVAGVALLLILAFRLTVHRLGALSLALLGVTTGIDGFLLTFESSQAAKLLIALGQIGVFATTTVLVITHVPRHRIIFGPLVASGAYALASLAPFMGLYILVPRIELGLVLVGSAYLSCIVLLGRIPAPGLAPGNASAGAALPRLGLLLFGIGILVETLFRRALPQPWNLVGSWGLLASELLPPLVLGGLLLWRWPDRLGVGLRITTAALLLTALLAWFLPSARVALYFAGWSIAGLAEVLAIYIALRTVRSEMRLPSAIGLALGWWSARLLLFRSDTFLLPVLGGIFLTAGAVLLLLLVLPLRGRTPPPASESGTEAER